MFNHRSFLNLYAQLLMTYTADVLASNAFLPELLIFFMDWDVYVSMVKLQFADCTHINETIPFLFIQSFTTYKQKDLHPGHNKSFINSSNITVSKSLYPSTLCLGCLQTTCLIFLADTVFSSLTIFNSIVFISVLVTMKSSFKSISSLRLLFLVYLSLLSNNQDLHCSSEELLSSAIF